MSFYHKHLHFPKPNAALLSGRSCSFKSLGNPDIHQSFDTSLGHYDLAKRLGVKKRWEICLTGMDMRARMGLDKVTKGHSRTPSFWNIDRHTKGRFVSKGHPQNYWNGGHHKEGARLPTYRNTIACEQLIRTLIRKSIQPFCPACVDMLHIYSVMSLDSCISLLPMGLEDGDLRGCHGSNKGMLMLDVWRH